MKCEVADLEPPNRLEDAAQHSLCALTAVWPFLPIVTASSNQEDISQLDSLITGQLTVLCFLERDYGAETMRVQTHIMKSLQISLLHLLRRSMWHLIFFFFFFCKSDPVM